MTARKPETPEEQWAALEATMLASEAEALDAMTDEEVDASLAEQGFDVARVKADGQAFVAGLLAGLDAERARAPVAEATKPTPPIAEAPEPSRSNVIAFAPRKQTTRASWTILLVAAAFCGTFAITVGGSVALVSPPARGPTTQVLADTQTAKIEALRANAESAYYDGSWKECLASLDEAAALEPEDAGGGREIRTQCADLAVQSLVADARLAAAVGNWGACVGDLNEAWSVSNDPDAGPPALRKVCDDRLAAESNAKAP